MAHDADDPPARAGVSVEQAQLASESVTDLFREHHLELVRLALVMVGDLATVGGWYFNSPGAEPTGEQLFQTGAADNSGSYSNAEMNSLITATHISNSLSTFRAYANYTAEQVPSLWMPSPVTVMAVSKHLHRASQNPLGTFLPEYWKCTSKKC